MEEPYKTPVPEGLEDTYEKVEKMPPEQDEEVTTSTSFTGEEAEEDRYDPSASPYGAAASGASDNLLNFDDDDNFQSSDRTPITESNDLLNMGSPAAPIASAPPLAPSQAESNNVADLLGEFGASAKTVSPSEPESSSFMPDIKPKPEKVEVSRPPADSWLKNVDPRDKTEAEESISEESDMGGIHSPYEDHTEIRETFTPAPIPSSIAEEPTPIALNTSILDLIYWRDIKKTGVVFGSMLFILLSLACFSVLSVLAYLSLALLTITLSFRVYKNVLQAVQKTGDAHPFRDYLDKDIEVTSDQANHVVKNVLSHVNATTRELRRLFLIEDLVDSLKVQIDNYVNLACVQVNNAVKQVQDKVPFLKKKEKKQ
ncbi:hypothetical protein FSP39_008549 [Pinctada imbricata]|uniref:Reticulon-like protein n=1 Tax=Pinctada imbricata TaxID=66713 RepID=A0AA88YAV7_PINIB|nr:hypothetical protein FSP39_008549 [Pinctada imbricata]